MMNFSYFILFTEMNIRFFHIYPSLYIKMKKLEIFFSIFIYLLFWKLRLYVRVMWENQKNKNFQLFVNYFRTTVHTATKKTQRDLEWKEFPFRCVFHGIAIFVLCIQPHRTNSRKEEHSHNEFNENLFQFSAKRKSIHQL